MSVSYSGGLGTTVTVRPVDANVSVGFDSTLVLIGENSGGSATDKELNFLDTQSDANDLYGSSSEIAKAYTAATLNGASEVYGISIDSNDTDPYQAATDEVMSGISPRYIVPCTETQAEQDNVLASVNDWADDLNFARVIAPGDDVSTGNISSYSPTNDDQRYAEVAPKRGKTGGENAFTAAAVAGHASQQPLGSSITFDNLNISDLSTEYRRTEAVDFGEVTAVTRDGKITEGVTTSTEDAFSDIFQVEIVDAVAQGVDEIAQQYAGDRPNTEDARQDLVGDVDRFLGPLTQDRPPLLSTAEGGPAYAVDTVVESDEKISLNVAISPVSVMKQIDINFDVGSVLTFEGVSA